MMEKNSYKTELVDRTLWYDGDSSYNSQQLCSYILSGKPLDETIKVTKKDADINKFNLVSDFRLQEKVETELSLDKSWNIPSEFKTLNLKQHFYSLLLVESEISDFTNDEVEERISRVNKELALWKRHNVENLLRTCIYIVATFKKENIVWGTGRGSACASYVLYLLELHDVDSVFFDVDINEFFRN